MIFLTFVFSKNINFTENRKLAKKYFPTFVSESNSQ